MSEDKPWKQNKTTTKQTNKQPQKKQAEFQK